MAKVNLGELNNYVKSLYNQVNLEELTGIHAEAIRAWFIENMTKIGRYSNRDFERFGSLSSTQDRQGRQDGWVALTEEVADIDAVTYGTGALYIHGEMEIPGSTAGIKGDTFHHCDATGQDFIKTPKSYGDTKGGFSGEDRTSDQGENEPDFALGFVWSFVEIQPQSGNHGYTDIVKSVSGIPIASEKAILPKVTSGRATPSRFNDGSVYHLSNERNNYPWVIINSTQPKSIDNLLKNTFNNDTGMYDRRTPWIARKGGYAPGNRVKVTTADRQEILNYISPTIDEYTPLPQTEDDNEVFSIPDGLVMSGDMNVEAFGSRTTLTHDIVVPAEGRTVSSSFVTSSDPLHGAQFNFELLTLPGGMLEVWVSDTPGGRAVSGDCGTIKSAFLSVLHVKQQLTGRTCSLNTSTEYFLNMRHLDPSVAEKTYRRTTAKTLSTSIEDEFDVSPSNGRLLLIAPIPHETMGNTIRLDQLLDLPVGRVVSSMFTTIDSVTSYGEFVFHDVPGDPLPYPSVNFWISRTPNGAPIVTGVMEVEAIKYNGNGVSWLKWTNYDAGFSGFITLEPNTEYYLNVEDVNNYGQSGRIDRWIRVLRL